MQLSFYHGSLSSFPQYSTQLIAISPISFGDTYPPHFCGLYVVSLLCFARFLCYCISCIASCTRSAKVTMHQRTQCRQRRYPRLPCPPHHLLYQLSQLRNVYHPLKTLHLLTVFVISYGRDQSYSANTSCKSHHCYAKHMYGPPFSTHSPNICVIRIS